MHAIDEDARFRLLRAAMVNDLRDRNIGDPRVLRAMAKIPRHLFVPRELHCRAYEDRPLPIGEHQTISQPYIVAKTLQVLELAGHERILEVGTGTGYQAALLAELAREVWTVEIVPELAKTARARLDELGYTNVHVITGDGSLGLPEHAPFDAIAVAAASPGTPRLLLAQLSSSGRLVVPVGDRESQILQRMTCRNQRAASEALLSCAFVPLLGEEGWSDRDSRRVDSELPTAVSGM
jgi:protein-L-isoaspartate(D-aspartate) O-methyltransferase